MENLIKDLRYAAHRLVNRRLALRLSMFSLLPLGIGINTTVFSLANSVFLRQLPVVSPQSLVWVFSNQEHPSSYRSMSGITSN